MSRPRQSFFSKSKSRSVLRNWDWDWDDQDKGEVGAFGERYLARSDSDVSVNEKSPIFLRSEPEDSQSHLASEVSKRLRGFSGLQPTKLNSSLTNNGYEKCIRNNETSSCMEDSEEFNIIDDSPSKGNNDGVVDTRTSIAPGEEDINLISENGVCSSEQQRPFPTSFHRSGTKRRMSPIHKLHQQMLRKTVNNQVSRNSIVKQPKTQPRTMGIRPSLPKVNPVDANNQDCFTTPKKNQRLRLGNTFPSTHNSTEEVILESDEDDIHKLEDSILCDDSPIKEVKRKCIKYTEKNMSTFGSESSLSLSQFVSSDRISEYTSAQSSPVAPTQTPMSEWIYQDQDQTNEDDDDINHFESPNKHNTINNKPTKSGSLLTSFKAIKARYNSSVQLFKHDHRKGKYAEEDSLQLVIRKILGHHDRLLETIAFDLVEEKDRWILFKPQDTLEIVEGTCLKLYFPWYKKQEITTPGSTYPMIIGADFYKIVHDGFEASSQTMECIRNLSLPKPFTLQISKPLFMDFVPYTLKNNNTVQKQIDKYSIYINVDVLVLHVWKSLSPVIALVKDSDDLISLVEVDTAYGDAISMMLRARYVKLIQIIFSSKINISEKLELFSIISLYGPKQTHYYVMRADPETKFETETFLNISMPDSYIDFKTVEDVCENVSSDDYRISLRCCIRQQQTKCYVLVASESSLEMKIETLTDSKSLVPANLVNKFVVLKFIRLVYGKAIWDQYSYIE